MTALLALHIEAALDPAETDLIRSMARISISQTMLLLTQGREIPALKRALPIFEEILAKKNLYSVVASSNVLCPAHAVTCMQLPSQESNNNHGSMAADAYNALPNAPQTSVALSQLWPWENDPSVYGDILGFDLLDEWQIDKLDFGEQDTDVLS